MGDDEKKPSRPVVDKRLSTKDRRIELERLIKDHGLWNLSTYKELGEKFGVCAQMIHKDIRAIIDHIDPNAVNNVFKEFFYANMKSQEELRKMIENSSGLERVNAIRTMNQLQKSFTELLEGYGHKEKIADKLDIGMPDIKFEMIDKSKKENDN